MFTDEHALACRQIIQGALEEDGSEDLCLDDAVDLCYGQMPPEGKDSHEIRNAICEYFGENRL